MAYVYQYRRKDGTTDPVWRIQFRDWTGRKRKVKGVRSQRESEKLAAELESRHGLIRKGEIKPPRKLDRLPPPAQLIEDYMAWGRSQGGRGGRPWSRVHARMRKTYLAFWRERLRPKALEDFKYCITVVERELRALQAEGKAGRTVSQHAETLAAFFAWCVDRDYLPDNPLRKLTKFDRSPRTIRRALTLDEVHRLLNAAPVERRLLYEVAFSTGLRANELRSLTLAHLDIEHCGVRLDAEWTKNRKPGFQPLPTDLVRRLVEFHRTDVITQKFERFYVRRDAQNAPKDRLLYILSNPVKAFDDDLAKAGIPKVTREGKVDFHSLRVAYATFLIETGASVKEAQTLLRHSTAYLTLNVYAKVREERLSEVVERLANRIFCPPEGRKQRSAGDTLPPTCGQVCAPSVPHSGGEQIVDDCNQLSLVVEGTPTYRKSVSKPALLVTP